MGKASSPLAPPKWRTRHSARRWRGKSRLTPAPTLPKKICRPILSACLAGAFRDLGRKVAEVRSAVDLPRRQGRGPGSAVEGVERPADVAVVEAVRVDRRQAGRVHLDDRAG